MFRFRRIVLAAIFLAIVPVSAGSADARFIPGLDRVGSDEGEIYRKGCMAGDERVKPKVCRFGDLSSRRKVVLLGDSHAAHWGPGLIRLARKKGWQVIALTRPRCSAALVNIEYYCDTWRRNALKRIREMRPGLVVVASAANHQSYSVRKGGHGLSRASSEGLLLDGMVKTLRKLKRWSGQVVVIRDQSVAPFSVTDCLRKHGSRPRKCGFRPQRSKRWSYDYKAGRRVEGVRVIDSQPLLCPDGWCRAVDGRYLIYRSTGHLAASFTRTQHGWLGRELGDPWREESRNPVVARSRPLMDPMVPVVDSPGPLLDPLWPGLVRWPVP